MTAKHDTTQGDGAQGKKRRHNVGKACENCRRRRVKCDGVQPECGTCRVYKDDCSWDAREDLRKPISRQQVEALQTRIADLEKMLKDHGVDPGHTSPGHTDAEASDRKPLPDTGRDDMPDRDSAADWPESHLVEDGTGDFQVYGPTSAFRHLSISQHTRTSPMEDSSMPGFRRYLPHDVDLTEEEHELALDRFFRYYAAWGERTHPVLFRQEMHLALYTSTPPKTPHFSPFLHNSILAIALCFSDNPELRRSETRSRFADEAKQFVDQEVTSPTVATVQALLHLASYYSTSAEHNLGWTTMGMALRCALALGLNIDNSHMVKTGKLTEVQARERIVTQYTLFIQEQLWAPYVGRPVTWPESTCPPPIVDEQLDSMIWEPDFVPGRVVHQRIKPQPCNISSAFVETVKLMEIGSRIMKTLYGLKSDAATLASSGVISEISLSLTTWHEQLPPQLVITSHSTKNLLPHILMMHLSWAWLSVLLHRPFYRPTAKLPGQTGKQSEHEGYNAAMAIKHCDRAAAHIVNLLQTWHRLHDLRFCPPTALQCCFVAGTTHLLAFVSNKTPKRKADALDRAKDCIRLMSYMAVSWPAGKQKQTLLENLLVEYGAKMDDTEHPAPPTSPPIPPTSFDLLGPFAQHNTESGIAYQTPAQPSSTAPFRHEQSDQQIPPSWLPSESFDSGVRLRVPRSQSLSPPFMFSSYTDEPQYLQPFHSGSFNQAMPVPTHQPLQHIPTPPLQDPREQRVPSFSNMDRQPLFHQDNHAQLFYADVAPWQDGQERGYLDVASDTVQPRDIYDPNVGSGQAQLELNVADPSAQALLRFLMQSDYEFSMRGGQAAPF